MVKLVLLVGYAEQPFRERKLRTLPNGCLLFTHKHITKRVYCKISVLYSLKPPIPLNYTIKISCPLEAETN